MLTLFFITFFIAELIIFTAITLKIHKINVAVNALNEEVLAINKDLAKEFFRLRLYIRFFNISFIRVRRLIIKKRNDYIFSISKKALLFGGIFLIKGKWANVGKFIAAFDIGKEIFEEIIKES